MQQSLIIITSKTPARDLHLPGCREARGFKSLIPLEGQDGTEGKGDIRLGVQEAQKMKTMPPSVGLCASGLLFPAVRQVHLGLWPPNQGHFPDSLAQNQVLPPKWELK